MVLERKVNTTKYSKNDLINFITHYEIMNFSKLIFESVNVLRYKF